MNSPSQQLVTYSTDGPMVDAVRTADGTPLGRWDGTVGRGMVAHGASSDATYTDGDWRESMAAVAIRRPLYVIVGELATAYPKITVLGDQSFFGAGAHPAAPYLDALRHLDHLRDSYGHDDGRELVTRLLGNIRSLRGPVAQRIRNELRTMLEQPGGVFHSMGSDVVRAHRSAPMFEVIAEGTIQL